MLKNHLRSLVVALVLCWCGSSAFAPAIHRAVLVPAMAATQRVSYMKNAPLLFMSEEPEAASETEETKEGDIYDDEVEPYQSTLSDNMRARLMAEASTGLDPDQKQTNVILYIMIGVAILVIVGGAGIFY